jgi:hypothetical protein
MNSADVCSIPSVYLILHTTISKSRIGPDLLAKISEMRVDGGLPNASEARHFYKSFTLMVMFLRALREKQDANLLL